MTPIRSERAREDAIEARRDELVTVKEFAWMVRKHPETIRVRIRAGRQPGALRVGGQWRIDVAIALEAGGKISASDSTAA